MRRRRRRRRRFGSSRRSRGHFDSARESSSYRRSVRFSSGSVDVLLCLSLLRAKREIFFLIILTTRLLLENRTIFVLIFIYSLLFTVYFAKYFSLLHEFILITFSGLFFLFYYQFFSLIFIKILWSRILNIYNERRIHLFIHFFNEEIDILL